MGLATADEQPVTEGTFSSLGKQHRHVFQIITATIEAGMIKLDPNAPASRNTPDSSLSGPDSYFIPSRTSDPIPSPLLDRHPGIYGQTTRLALQKKLMSAHISNSTPLLATTHLSRRSYSRTEASGSAFKKRFCRIHCDLRSRPRR